ncbi:mitochondrial inner membrane protein Mitofilin [Suillus paluster]|uniref:mitochondrial inner membrane protein Mitofilin n=1 Tax=Suillus paluster TaxID=48578 RepID=UPI001B867D9B|nr:mitochondrial inner membrane protein Mitofilin [Suillus paluster]KAG1738352.1 mitochondrial inner membrane protein Mitofilin [Suillus paluster]
MYRAIAVPRHVPATVGRGLVRSSRRRLVSTTTTSTSNSSSGPNPAKNIVRKILFYTVATTGTFYIGSTFVSFENQQYRELFTENVPLGKELVEYGESHNWDEVTVEQVVVATVDAYKNVYNFAQRQLGNAPTEETSEKTANSALKESKERVKSAVASLKTAVKKVEEEKVPEATAKAMAIARHHGAEFADELDDLIHKAEAAIAGKPVESLPKATITPAQPASSPADTISLRDDTDLIIVSDKNTNNVIVYAVPLPIGFEPPPGYERPAPPKPAPKAPAEPTPVPLPLVAPAVSEVAVSEPVITQLASTIDNLASFLASNPAASEKAKDVLEIAKGDLTGLAARIEKIKEDEKLQLEMKLDEQAREYTTKLLELELEAQDKLDSQQEGFRTFYDQERARFSQVYREKLEQELRTQTELINERLKEEVIAQGIEMQRRWIREVKVHVEQERGGRLAKLDELATNLKRLERLALDNSSYLDENIRVHSMWTALRAMQSAVDASTRKPFREELRVLRHIAVAKEDAIIAAALDSLEQSDMPDIGVEPFADLASWFNTTVRPRVSSVALVPDQNAGVLTHLASHFLSSFRFQQQGLVPGSDVLSVLSRADYHMNEKDLDSAARELNQLKGTARELLHDWLEAARRRLEVLQALEVIQSQATLASLLVV